jgi:DNA-binding NtrC family response regulator
MRIECALLCRGKAAVKLEVWEPALLREAVGKGRLPAAVVVRSADLGLLRECGELFKDRHQKDERKALATLMLGQGDSIPLIDTKFTGDGRLKQGVDALLAKAEEKGEAGIYVLGVGEEVFREVWREAVTEDEALRPESSDKALLQLMTPLPGEAKLSRTFWGDSEDYHLVRQLILRAARVDDPVLILGETGTGKGVVARAIHNLSRQDQPFVEVNCAAIPSELFETELFGYVPGAFTGALKDGKTGQWEVARDGTLFLDEVGDLRKDHQAGILHVLQEGYIRRVGSVVNTKVSARVIAATNRNLLSMVESGEFREDLYYRLRQFLIYTPDLRDDSRNLELIAQEVWHEITKSDARLPKEIVEDLCRHRWPGNVREMRSVLGSLNNFFGSHDLKRKHLNAIFQHFGLAVGYGEREDVDEQPALLRVECLRMIRRADDAIRACEQELKPVASGLGLSGAGRDSLARLRVEMHSLMRNRLYFGSPETYQAVERVEEGLGRLLQIQEADSKAMLGFWKEALGKDIRQAVERLFGELQKLRG